MAEAVGGEWPQRARKAAQGLSGEGVNEDDSIKVQLLIDIRDILEEWEQPHIPSADLVMKLVALEDRPWCEFGRTGKPLTQRTLANLLRPFGISSGAHRRNDLVFKGYPVAKLEDAFKRYIPAPKEGLNTPSAQDRGSLSVTPLQPAVHSHAGETLSVTREPAVTDAKTAKMAPQLRCNAVTDKKGVNGAGVWTTPSFEVKPSQQTSSAINGHKLNGDKPPGQPDTSNSAPLPVDPSKDATF